MKHVSPNTQPPLVRLDVLDEQLGVAIHRQDSQSNGFMQAFLKVEALRRTFQAPLVVTALVDLGALRRSLLVNAR